MNVRAGSKSLFHMRGSVRYELTLAPPGLYSVSYPIRVLLRMCIYLACCSRRLKCRCSWMFWFPCQCLKCSEEMLMETTGHWGEKRKNLFDIHSDQWQWWFNIFWVSTCHFCREVYPQSQVFSCGQVWMLTWTCFFYAFVRNVVPSSCFSSWLKWINYTWKHM